MKAPFSLRSGGPQPWVQDDWPRSARTGLMHLLHDVVGKDYVGGWIAIDQELRRIAREPYVEYSWDRADHAVDAFHSAEAILVKLPWPRVFDFCERLHSHLARSIQTWDHNANDWEEVTSRDEVQRYIADQVQRLFLEENFGYSFSDGEVRRRERNHTRELMSTAEPTLGDPRLDEARKHYIKATHYFRNPSKPDYENAVKEAVCAVEATARRLFPDTNAKTLGEAVKRLIGTDKGQLPKPIADTITGLYAFRNSGEGVSHGGADGGEVTRSIAEYILAVAASQVILLHEVAAASDTEVPF